MFACGGGTETLLAVLTDRPGAAATDVLADFHPAIRV